MAQATAHVPVEQAEASERLPRRSNATMMMIRSAYRADRQPERPLRGQAQSAVSAIAESFHDDEHADADRITKQIEA